MKKTRDNIGALKYLLIAVFALLGAVGGYLYYRFIGCASGSCAITSNLYISTIYGGVLGALIGFIVAPQKGKNDEKSSEM